MENGLAVISSDGVVRSSLPDVSIPDETLPAFIWGQAMKYPNHHAAFTCGVTGRSYTFKDARTISLQFGAALQKKKFKPGDVLAIMMPNNIEFPLILLGALEAGFLVTSIDPTSKKNELMHHMQMTRPKVVVTVATLVPFITEALKSMETMVPIITIDRCEEQTELARELWDFQDLVSCSGNEPEITVKVSPEAVALLPPSSGTTGTSKIVAKTHKNVIATLKMLCEIIIVSLKNHPQVTEAENRDVRILALPICHFFAQMVALSGLIRGSNVIVLPSQEPQILCRVISSQNPLTVTLNCNPTMIVDLNPLVKSDDLQSLQRIYCGTSPIISSPINAFLDKLPKREDVNFINGYGLTEASGIFLPTPDHPDYNAIGYLMPNMEVKVVDSLGNSLGPGEEGELYLRGPQVVKEYYNNGEATAQAFDGDWFKTGDVVYYDELGMFYLIGRSKELIKVKGLQVSPVELETVLLSHPSIEDAGVVGVPDDVTGEKAVAFVIPKRGVKVDPDEVCAFVASQVSPNKKLSEVIVTDSIPRNTSGKMLKHILKEEYILTRSRIG